MKTTHIDKARASGETFLQDLADMAEICRKQAEHADGVSALVEALLSSMPDTKQMEEIAKIVKVLKPDDNVSPFVPSGKKANGAAANA